MDGWKLPRKLVEHVHVVHRILNSQRYHFPVPISPPVNRVLIEGYAGVQRSNTNDPLYHYFWLVSISSPVERPSGES